MTMPRFAAGDDPGASFPDLLRKVGIEPFPAAALRGETSRVDSLRGNDTVLPHATTCLALTYDGGEAWHRHVDIFIAAWPVSSLVEQVYCPPFCT
ncbi:MAG: hypothetical protein ACKODN_01800 [Actinomycetota bacterium]